MENLTTIWKTENYVRSEGPRYWAVELKEDRS